jgi:hypothetical protein
MAQAVSRRYLTAEARVRDRVNPCGICGVQYKVALGQVFLRLLRFPPPSITTLWLSVLIYHLRGWTTGPLEAAVLRHIFTPSTWTTEATTSLRKMCAGRTKHIGGPRARNPVVRSKDNFLRWIEMVLEGFFANKRIYCLLPLQHNTV